jgi:hypothetical protein
VWWPAGPCLDGPRCGRSWSTLWVVSVGLSFEACPRLVVYVSRSSPKVALVWKAWSTWRKSGDLGVMYCKSLLRLSGAVGVQGLVVGDV